MLDVLEIFSGEEPEGREPESSEEAELACIYLAFYPYLGAAA